MANFKPQIRGEQPRTDGTVNIKIRLTHKGKTRYIRTDYYVKPSEFDAKEGLVKKHKNATRINMSLRTTINQYEEQLLKQGPLVNQKDIKSLLDIIKSSINGEVDFYKYLHKHLDMLHKSGQDSYANLYEHTEKWLKEYSPLESLPFNHINYSFLVNFEAYYKSKKKKTNTIAIHLRNIRALFKVAINSDIIGTECYPFMKFKIKEEKTAHRNLSKEEIVTLLKYTPKSKTEERFLDLLFLSLYLIGANYIDILNAKPDQVVNGRLNYNRAKTGKPYSIKIQPAAKEIIHKYRGGSDYLLRFMEDKEKSCKNTNRKTPLYKDIIDQTNKVLKRIFNECGLGRRGSTYFVRHTWASIAEELEIQWSVIQMGLGHETNSVTDRYVYTDIKKVDQANAKVIKYLLDGVDPAK